MRRARVDRNHPEIAKALRGIGCSVFSTARLGSGFPDLVVGYRKKNVLLEVKDGEKSPSERRLTQDEQEFHDAWRGTVHVVESVDDALRIVREA